MAERTLEQIEAFACDLWVGDEKQLAADVRGLAARLRKLKPAVAIIEVAKSRMRFIESDSADYILAEQRLTFTAEEIETVLRAVWEAGHE